MGLSENYFDSYSSASQYYNFDVINGIASTTENAFYYSLTNNIGQSPAAQYSYNVYSGIRSKDEVTLYIIATGNAPRPNPGSMFYCNVADPKANFTGMVTYAELNGASGFVKYPNGGRNGVFGSGGTILSMVNPHWSSGFFFQPSYSSSIENKNSVTTATYGDGYSQRIRNGLNNNVGTWTLVFDSRSDAECLAIENFVSDKGGADAVAILIAPAKIRTNPNQRFTLSECKRVFNSHELTTINVTATQVFDPI